MLQYFELRFGKGLRLFGSAMFVLGSVRFFRIFKLKTVIENDIFQILWLPIAIYVPALTFMQGS